MQSHFPFSIQHRVTGSSASLASGESLEAPHRASGESLGAPHTTGASSSLSMALVPPSPPVTFEEQNSQCFEDVDPFDHLQASFVNQETQQVGDIGSPTQPEEPNIPLNWPDIVQALIKAAKE